MPTKEMLAAMMALVTSVDNARLSGCDRRAGRLPFDLVNRLGYEPPELARVGLAEVRVLDHACDRSDPKYDEVGANADSLRGSGYCIGGRRGPDLWKRHCSYGRCNRLSARGPRQALAPGKDVIYTVIRSNRARTSHQQFIQQRYLPILILDGYLELAFLCGWPLEPRQTARRDRASTRGGGVNRPARRQVGEGEQL